MIWKQGLMDNFHFHSDFRGGLQARMNLSEPGYVEPAYVGTVRLANIFIKSFCLHLIFHSHCPRVYHYCHVHISFHLFPYLSSCWSGGPLREFSFQLLAFSGFLVNMEIYKNTLNIPLFLLLTPRNWYWNRGLWPNVLKTSWTLSYHVICLQYPLCTVS